MELVIGYEGGKKQYFILDTATGYLVECYETKEEAYGSLLPDDKGFKVLQIIYKGYGCVPPKDYSELQSKNEGTVADI